jgi:peptidoglycan LD-endopeptidase LytH
VTLPASWKHDVRTFALGAICGLLVGIALLSVAFQRFNRPVPPGSSDRPIRPPGVEGFDQTMAPIDPAPAATTGRSPGPTPTSDGPVIGPPPGDVGELNRRKLDMPVDNVRRDQLVRSFEDRRGQERSHEALDIPAPRHTPVRAVEDGTIARLFLSKAGGTTIYQFDPTGRYCYYYAHLERYADGLKEGGKVDRGQVIGYVGTSGNAPKNAPHLHFAVFRLTADRHWWEGTPLDPYDVLR